MSRASLLLRVTRDEKRPSSCPPQCAICMPLRLTWKPHADCSKGGHGIGVGRDVAVAIEDVVADAPAGLRYQRRPRAGYWIDCRRCLAVAIPVNRGLAIRRERPFDLVNQQLRRDGSIRRRPSGQVIASSHPAAAGEEQETQHRQATRLRNQSPGDQRRGKRQGEVARQLSEVQRVDRAVVIEIALRPEIA